MKKVYFVLLMFIATFGLICSATPTISPSKVDHRSSIIVANYVDNNVNNFVITNDIVINNDAFIVQSYNKYTCDIYSFKTQEPSTNLYAYALLKGGKRGHKGGHKGGKGKKG
jgi:hypothetical protein